MGFWSSVGSFISGCASTIGSVIRSVGSAVGGFAGSAIKAVSNLVPVLSKWAGNIGIAVQVIGIVIDVVSKILNIIKEHETVPDIGERALQAEEQGITLESCDNDFDAYMEKIRNIKLNPQRTHQSHEQWLAGSLLLEKGLEQKYPNMCTSAMWPIIVRNADFFTKERMAAYAQVAMEKNVPFGESIAKYFTPRTNSRIDIATNDYLKEAEKRFNPRATPNDIIDEFHRVKANCAGADRENNKPSM